MELKDETVITCVEILGSIMDIALISLEKERKSSNHENSGLPNTQMFKNEYNSRLVSSRYLIMSMTKLA